MRKIGLSKQLDGLYYLKLSQVKLNASVHVANVDLSRLWNLRLIHLSHDKTKCLNKKHTYIPFLAKALCDVFHMAK